MGKSLLSCFFLRHSVVLVNILVLDIALIHIILGIIVAKEVY